MKNRKLMSNKQASEFDAEAIARREIDRVSKAGKRASESDAETVRIQKKIGS